MFQKVVIGALALAALSTTALAADLPSRRAPPVYIPPPVPVFTWTGFYLGGNAGYAFDSHTSYGLSPNDGLAAAGLAAGNVSPFARTSGNGFTGGGQVGYNFELSSLTGGVPGLGSLTGAFGSGLVAGVEADAAYTDLRSNGTNLGTGGFATNYSSRTDYVGTVRGRLGFAIDRVYVYGTGGFAYGGVRDGVAVNSAAGVTGYAGNSDTIRTGYAYGGGVEYALPTASFLNVFNSSAVTIKAEFIHYDLGTSSMLVPGNAAAGTAGSSFVARVKNDGNLVRAGLNFKFGSPIAAPVVARY